MDPPVASRQRAAVREGSSSSDTDTTTSPRRDSRIPVPNAFSSAAINSGGAARRLASPQSHEETLAMLSGAPGSLLAVSRDAVPTVGSSSKAVNTTMTGIPSIAKANKDKPLPTLHAESSSQAKSAGIFHDASEHPPALQSPETPEKRNWTKSSSRKQKITDTMDSPFTLDDPDYLTGHVFLDTPEPKASRTDAQSNVIRSKLLPPTTSTATIGTVHKANVVLNAPSQTRMSIGSPLEMMVPGTPKYVRRGSEPGSPSSRFSPGTRVTHDPHGPTLYTSPSADKVLLHGPERAPKFGELFPSLPRLRGGGSDISPSQPSRSEVGRKRLPDPHRRSSTARGTYTAHQSGNQRTYQHSTIFPKDPSVPTHAALMLRKNPLMPSERDSHPGSRLMLSSELDGASGDTIGGTKEDLGSESEREDRGRSTESTPAKQKRSITPHTNTFFGRSEQSQASNLPLNAVAPYNQGSRGDSGQAQSSKGKEREHPVRTDSRESREARVAPPVNVKQHPAPLATVRPLRTAYQPMAAKSGHLPLYTAATTYQAKTSSSSSIARFTAGSSSSSPGLQHCVPPAWSHKDHTGTPFQVAGSSSESRPVMGFLLPHELIAATTPTGPHRKPDLSALPLPTPPLPVSSLPSGNPSSTSLQGRPSMSSSRMKRRGTQTSNTGSREDTSRAPSRAEKAASKFKAIFSRPMQSQPALPPSVPPRSALRAVASLEDTISPLPSEDPVAAVAQTSLKVAEKARLVESLKEKARLEELSQMLMDVVASAKGAQAAAEDGEAAAGRAREAANAANNAYYIVREKMHLIYKKCHE